MSKKLLSGLSGILVALIIGAIVMLGQGYNPIATYGALFKYSWGGLYPLATMLKNSVPLVLTGLSASVAFASGPVNLGQPGQFLIGALFATVGGLYLDLPPVLMVPALLLLSMLGGALWSGVAALLRRLFNMDEFITTLMLNMIADFFTYWAISYPLFDRTAFSPMTPAINRAGWMPVIGQFNTSVLVMVIAFVVILFVFNRWTAGYEWRLTGQNSIFARIGGIDINKNYVTVMLVTGALAGLAGGLVLMAGPHRFLKGLGANYAWDGVMIAVVANNGLIATLLYGLFFSTLQTGALGMELITAVPSEFIQVLQAVTVLVIVAGRETIDIIVDRSVRRRKVRERTA
ncbi:MAG TPA: ABC transporter permease [Chloroflexi bacterium]|nr:ABC transporter permease [Chloroflexota bacterium]HPO58215.1 ABC transporter permease [Anaerolineaceae bacterium]